MSAGAACSRCEVSEARCAYVGGCCRECSHFLHLDAAGNDLPAVPVQQRVDASEWPRCTDCGRRVGPRGRNDCPGLCRIRQREYWRLRQRARSRGERYRVGVAS